MLYSESDYEVINARMKKFVLIYIVATVLFIATFVASCVLRVAWPGYAVGSVWAIGTVFFWGLVGSRIRKYRNFLKDIAIGLERQVAGQIESIDESISIRQGLEFYGLNLISDDCDPKETSRRVYYDAAKGRPPFEVGERVQLMLFGNFIKGKLNET